MVRVLPRSGRGSGQSTHDGGTTTAPTGVRPTSFGPPPPLAVGDSRIRPCGPRSPRLLVGGGTGPRSPRVLVGGGTGPTPRTPRTSSRSGWPAEGSRTTAIARRVRGLPLLSFGRPPTLPTHFPEDDRWIPIRPLPPPSVPLTRGRAARSDAPPGLRAQLGASKDAVVALLRAHIDLAKAEKPTRSRTRSGARAAVRRYRLRLPRSCSPSWSRSA